MSHIRLYVEVSSLIKSFFLIITFPLYLLGFSVNALCKRLWISTLTIGIIQKLWSPRFGTNLFSRFGRVTISHLNFNTLIGGSLAGVAILFFLYQPEIHKFDGQYYVVFQQQGVESVSAQEASPSAEPVASIEPTSTSSSSILPSSMPIVTQITATPTPVPVRKQQFIPPQSLPSTFVPPAIANSGTYYSPLHNKLCATIKESPCVLVTTQYRGGHPGMDLAISLGTPLYAVGDGYVESVGSTIWAYGNVVYVNHGGGIVSLYAHMSRVDVKPGQQVNKDTIIGAVGSTGHSSGPHVHLEMHKDGAAFNPASVLKWF
jgi:murein DD-endopeptidase MepM/ murein hydrolase activator NlpD